MKNPSFVLVAIFIALGALPAQAELVSQAVEYQLGEQAFEGFLAWDNASQEPRPGILIVHEWWGLNDHPKKRAERLAELGYIAFALDMYGKGKVTDDPTQAGAWAGEIRTNFPLARERFVKALEVLRANPRTDPKRIAAIGFCFGGTVCLEMARAGVDLAGVVSFHGGLKSSVPDEQKHLKAKVLVCHGADDPHISAEELKAFEDEMRKTGADWQLISYGGAVHSFTNPEADARGMNGVAYHEKADRRSWRAMQDFFIEIFEK